MKNCKWKHVEKVGWDIMCQEKLYFIPVDMVRRFIFCPYCGEKIERKEDEG